MPTVNKQAFEKLIAQCLIRDRHSFRRRNAQAKTAADRARLNDNILASCQKVDARRNGLPNIHYPENLPVSEKAEDICALIKKHQVLIVAGETGSGKSTQLPKICLAAGQGIFGQIAHTQPRRIAARAIAARLAEELKVDLGKGVGYRVRFEEKCSEQDYIRVLTDGMLLAEAQTDHFLNQYDTIIIDEAHERSLNIDFLFGVIKQLLQKRKDLKVIITSATIDTEKFSKHFNDAPIISVTGRTYPVEVRYQTPADETTRSDRQTNEAILEAINRLFKTKVGNTLVFLPGEREIREAQRFLSRQMKLGIEILPLYARLAGKEQARLFRPSHATRVILSTNVAETSLTLPGIDYVVDVGLARISRYNPGRRVNTLPIERVSKAAANQRKGRCGRVKNGICVRLYSEEDFISREDFTAPEVLRTALTAVVLALKSRRLGEPEDFGFIDPPERKQLNAARQELKFLGALTDDNQLTNIGHALAKLPVDPRIGRMLYAAAHVEHCLPEMTILAASLEIPDPRLVPHESMQGAREHHKEQAKGRCDFFALLDLYARYSKQKKALSRKPLMNWCERHYLAPSRMREWQDLVKRLGRELSAFNTQKEHPQPASEEAVHRALLTGLLDQIAMKTDKGLYTGTFGKQLSIFPGSALSKTAPKWIMSAEMMETSQLFARTVAPIKTSWIETLAADLIRHEYSEPAWSQKSGHVLAFQRGYFLNLPIFSGRKKQYSHINPEEARALFIRDALVPGEINGTFEFIEHNLDQIDTVVKLEHKIRRHDVLVSEQTLVDFYTERLPENVLSESSLRKWLRTLDEPALERLCLTEADILKRALSDDERDLPDTLEYKDHALPLDYQYAPGEQHDGISTRIPLPLLNQLSQADFDKLIPGYLLEKIEYLIKSLPKVLRKKLAPLPETIAFIHQPLKQDTRPLLEAMADMLNLRAGLRADLHSDLFIKPSDFKLDNLPEHLTMKLVLLDEAGDELGRANNLQALQNNFGEQARESISEVAHHWQQTGLNSWSFDDLPDVVEVRPHGHITQAYPALVDAGSSVNLQLFDDADDAHTAHRSGVAKLVLLSGTFGQALSKRPLPYWQDISLRYSTIGAHQDLRSVFLETMLIEFIFEGGNTIKSKAQFEAAIQRLENGFNQNLEPYCKALSMALQGYTACREKSGEAINANIQDIHTQLDYLIYEDFLAEVSLSTLLHYPLYFKALQTRLERLGFDPQGDSKKMALLTPYWEKYLHHWEAHPHNAPLDAYRWLVEAYRVSLFAPTLKLPVTVSPKRLDKAWAAFQASI